ncbi:MAG: helix-turn-helix transcriptional regulator [Clostridia bacterium]|nr:helix-turn-helix transcriptional regulator [Clostridia bacterium]
MLCRIMPVIDLIRTGENIRKIRKQRGITVRQLQEIFGFSTPQAIYKWQQGTALPTVDNLLVLANVLDVPIEHILVLEKGNIE